MTTKKMRVCGQIRGAFGQMSGLVYLGAVSVLHTQSCMTYLSHNQSDINHQSTGITPPIACPRPTNAKAYSLYETIQDF